MSHHLPTGSLCHLWWPSALHYKAYKALARAIVQFNHSIACLCEWYEILEAKSRANFAQAHDEAQLSWAERFCLKSASHKPCSSILTCPMCFVPIFSVLFLQHDRKSSGPHQNVRNDGLRKQALWKHSFSVYWHIFPGCMLHVFSAGISLRLGCPKVTNMFQVHLPFPMALLTSDIDSIQYHQHSCIQPGPGPARVCRYIIGG